MVRSRVFQAAVKNAIVSTTTTTTRSSSTSTTTLASITNGLFHIIPTATTTTMLQRHHCQFNQKIVNSSSKRFFSSDDESSSPPQDLKAILERELQEEESEETAPPPELSDLLKDIETEWTITSSSSSNLGGGGGGGGATIKMYKKNAIPNGSKVSLVFHCQDTLPVVDTEDDDELDTGYLETEDNEEEEEEESTAVRFTLIVSKAGKVMIMKCTSEEAEVDVEGLAVVNEEDLIVGKEGEVDELLYQGPEFTELAQDLQEALTSYVRNECGIDSDVAAFISMYADYKEQVEYVSWLKDVKSMVS